MTEIRTIRVATPDDVSAVRSIAIETGLFDAADWAEVESIMLASVRGDLEDHSWIVLEDDFAVVAAAYYAPEPFSHHRWNMYFLGALPGCQGHGNGGALVAQIEAVLRQFYGAGDDKIVFWKALHATQ